MALDTFPAKCCEKDWIWPKNAKTYPNKLRLRTAKLLVFYIVVLVLYRCPPNATLLWISNVHEYFISFFKENPLYEIIYEL